MYSFLTLNVPSPTTLHLEQFLISHRARWVGLRRGTSSFSRYVSPRRCGTSPTVCRSWWRSYGDKLDVARSERGRVKLVVLTGDIDGRFSEETRTFVRLLVRTKTRSIPESLRTRVRRFWKHRWWSISAWIAVKTFASSLLDRRTHPEVDDTSPSDTGVLADFSKRHVLRGRVPRDGLLLRRS